MTNVKLSCTLAVFNEEANLPRCLESVKNFADEIIIVDGGSTDRTVEIARSFGAQVTIAENPQMFHINKNKANDLATGEWILQLDADEVVSEELREEIREVANINSKFEIRNNLKLKTKNLQLFERHQRAIEARDGKIGTDEGEVVAYFLPRRNYFLGKFLQYGGAYPDGVIRLFKKGKAQLPAKNLHEQYHIDGQVGWLFGDLYHYDSPTFERYLDRNNRYSSRFASELASKKITLDLFNSFYYLLVKPTTTFLKIYFRHKGFLDGFPGFVWAWYSGMTWMSAWVKYWEQCHCKRSK